MLPLVCLPQLLLVLCACHTNTSGAAVIKYGSLLISLPFEPSAAVALLLVLGTPSAYAVYLLAFKQGGGSQQQ